MSLDSSAVNTQTTFSADRLSELKEAFSLFDRDGDGALTASDHPFNMSNTSDIGFITTQELGTVLRAQQLRIKCGHLCDLE
jgi:hypothetical protein